MAADFPEVLLSNEQLANVKVVMLDRVFETDRTIQPRFHGCTFQPGDLVFSCKDEATAATRGAREDLIPYNGLN